MEQNYTHNMKRQTYKLTETWWNTAHFVKFTIQYVGHGVSRVFDISTRSTHNKESNTHLERMLLMNDVPLLQKTQNIDDSIHNTTQHVTSLGMGYNSIWQEISYQYLPMITIQMDFLRQRTDG